jgi:DNA polymerase-3 subunit gamma/tau
VPEDTVLYRKWRPRLFAELAGQEHVAKTLTNALESGRAAHAYLFAGPRGTGKTSTGRLLAKALNCTQRQAGEPCNACQSCQDFRAGRAMDLIELDAASNRGIDEIRSLREKVAFAPGAGAFKVYLIDEVHMLTEAAFNALLKTLEEPPPHAVFVLATTEAHKLPATISSRCQRFDFRRIPLAAAVKRLADICAGEAIACEPAALELIARSATGSLRDSVNLVDQLATSYGNDLTVEHVRSGLGLIGDARSGELARLAVTGGSQGLGGGLALIASVRDDGLDLRQFQRELVEELRALLLAKAGLDAEGGVTAERRRELQTAVADVPQTRIYAALRAFGEADLKSDPNSTLPLDIALAECLLSEGQSGDRAMGQGARSGDPSTDSGQALQVATSGEAAPRSAKAAAVISDRASASVRAEPVEARGRIGDAPPEGEAAGLIPQRPSQPNGNATAVEPSLEAARQRLRALYDRARSLEVHVGALLNGPCDIIAADEAALTFGFKYPAHAKKMLEADNLRVLAGAVADVMGRPVEVRCVHDPNVESWKQRETASRSPLVRAAQDMGARVLATPEEEM